MDLGSRACVWHCPAIRGHCVQGEWVNWFSYKNKSLQEPFLSSSLKLEDKLLLQTLAVNFSFWKNARGAQVEECVGFGHGMLSFLLPLFLNLELAANKMQREFMTNRLW